ncbi:MAG: protein TolQ [Sphingomonadales bacterium]
MEEQTITTVDLGGTVPDFSLWGMFSGADIVVQLVLLLLLVASFWCWSIIADKTIRYRRIDEKADAFEETFWSGASLDDLYARLKLQADHPMAMLFIAAMREWQRSHDMGAGAVGPNAALQERIHKVMRVTMNREIERLERYLGFLATVGSTAPFVGLFGTVWGIMNSFQSIALSHNTSLAVVAPGIAEALFATAMGLVAAIPAVIAYNKFANDMGRYSVRLEGFADEFTAILSRRLDQQAL